jgi:hypothetical protein
LTLGSHRAKVLAKGEAMAVDFQIPKALLNRHSLAIDRDDCLGDISTRLEIAHQQPRLAALAACLRLAALRCRCPCAVSFDQPRADCR